MIRRALARIAAIRRPAAKVDQARRAQVGQASSYMAGQASSMRFAWDVLHGIGNPALAGEMRMLQAGAAASQAMSDLLLAVATNDKQGFRQVLNDFVDAAVEVANA